MRQKVYSTEILVAATVKNNVQSTKEQYAKNKREFHEWLNTYMPDYEIQYEQLLVYFISTYFCGAVYDGEAYVKGTDGGCQCTFDPRTSAGTVAEE